MRGLLVLLLAAALVPVLLVQAGLYYRWVQAHRQRELQANLELARATGRTFATYVADLGREEFAIGAALTALTPYTTEQANALLRAAAGEYPGLRAFLLADPDGTIIAASISEAMGRSVAEREYFLKARAAPGWVLSDLLQDPIHSEPIFVVARSVRDEQGQVLGVLVAPVDPQRLGETAITSGDRPDQGRLILADRQGRLAYRDPDVELDWQQRLLNPRDALLAQALEGHEAVGVHASPLDEREQYAARVPIPALDWVAGAARPVDVVMAPLYRTLLMTAGLNLAALGVSILIALTIQRRINAGVGSLNRHAIALARGDLGHRANPRGILELESVAAAFNETARSRQQAEQALREADQGKSELLALLDSLLANAPIGFAFFDRQYRYVRVNEFLAKINGIPVEEHLGRTLRELMPDTATSVEPVVEQVFLTGEPVMNLEISGRTPASPELRHWLTGFYPVPSPEGAVLWVGAVVMEISDLKRVQEQLRTLNATLEQRVAERTAEAEHRAAQLRALAVELTQAEQRERRRLAQVLHDHLQQLLVGAKLRVSAAKGRLLEEPLQKAMDGVSELLDQAVEASRSLTVELSPPILYEGGLGAALEWLARWMRAKHGLEADLRVDPSAEPQSEQARVFLFQAARELLFNVVKHAGTNRASVGLDRQDEHIRLVVEDRGHGFDTATLDAPGHAESGFGLFSMRERAGLIGGSLTIYSTPQEGTRVTLTAPQGLPTAPTTAPEPPEAVDGPPKAPAETPAPSARRRRPARRRQIRVLLADDHHIVRQGLAGLLRLHDDIDVVAEASDGQTAVELARQFQPDVVVMDVSMPRLSGVEAARQLGVEMPHVRVIGLSMHAEADMAERMREAGAVGYVTKGGPSESLVRAIRAAVAPAAPQRSG